MAKTFKVLYGALSGVFLSTVVMAEPVSVKQARNLPNDSIVVLQGNIVEKVGYEKYLFKDASGEIVIDIDDEDLARLACKETDVLEIKGEINAAPASDKMQVDVNSVKKITKKT